MRTRVVHYDVRAPSAVFGLEGYAKLLLVLQDGPRPVATLIIPIPRGAAALGPRDIEPYIAARLSPGDLARPDAVHGKVPEDLPSISVVVCTKDRPASLDRCLSALRKLRYPDFEVLVIDNGSSGNATAEAARRHGVRCLREDRPGLDRARNRGIQEAAHDVVAFVDDDVQVDPNWLTAVGRAFTDPGVDAMTGLVLPSELETPAQNYFEMYGRGMNKGFSPRVWRRGRLTDTELIAVQHIGVGANMAARRSVYESVGGFDPALDVGTPAAGAGDLDMFHRLLAEGYTIRYEPCALVWHQHRRDLESLTTQLYNNGRSFGIYLLKLLRTGSAPRRVVLRYAAGTWVPWLIWRLVKGLARRHALPLRFLWAEVRGALTAPWAFRATYRWHRLSEDTP